MRPTILFSYKTIERPYDDPFVTLILNEVFKMTQEPVKELEKNFSADGTGLSKSVKQNWVRDKDDEERRVGYDGMVAMVGTTYGLISAVEFPDNPWRMTLRFSPTSSKKPPGAIHRWISRVWTKPFCQETTATRLKGSVLSRASPSNGGSL